MEHLEKSAFKAACHRVKRGETKRMTNVGLIGDADKSVEVYVAERTWPYEVNPPGRNKLHSFIQSFLTY